MWSILRPNEQGFFQRLVKAACVHEDATPWRFGFQCNERYLDWDLSAQRQLLKIVAAEELGISSDELTARIQQLGTLIPDLTTKLDVMKADLLVKLLSDPDELSQKLVVLREALPHANISDLVTRFPYLVADNTLAAIQMKIEKMAEALPEVDLPTLICKEPRLFDADLPKVLEDIKRLMGSEVDPVSVLISQPEIILTMEESGLTSAIDINEPTDSGE